MIMSEQRNSACDAERRKVFSSSDFLEFLSQNGTDISKLEVTTKSGDRISFDSTKDSDVFKSVEALKSFFPAIDENSGRAVSTDISQGNTSSIKDPMTSQEWTSNMSSKDWMNMSNLSYGKVFSEAAGKQGDGKNHTAPRTDWNAAFQHQLMMPPNNSENSSGARQSNGINPLDNLVEVAARAKPHPVAASMTGHRSFEISKSDSDKKRKSRKIVPEQKQFVDKYTNEDVLFGRGGRSNHHPGNKWYRELVTAKQEYYKGCDKNEKTRVAQAIVDQVHNEQKGRFLELDSATKRYFIVPNIMARRKVGQALRENNTEEARAAKRERYGTRNARGDITMSSPSTHSAISSSTAV